jgi:hypothetical protein
MSKKRVIDIDQQEAWVPPVEEEQGQPILNPQAAEQLKAPFLQFHQLKQQKDELEREMTELKDEIGLAQERCLKALEASGLKNLPIKGVGLFYGSVSVHPKATDEMMLFEDLRSRGAGDMIKETVHHKTLGAFIKELKARGEWETNPLKGVEIFEEPYIGFRREGGARDGGKDVSK